MSPGSHGFWQEPPTPVLFLNRLLLCALVWWVLSGGAAGSWAVGAPVAVIAAVLSSIMLPPFRWSLRGAIRFWPFFLWASLKGGVDVAARAMHRRLPLNPGVVEHRTRLAKPLAQVSMVNLMSLVPGTLAADLEDGYISIHALDSRGPVRQNVAISEGRIAALFALEQGVFESPEPG